MTRTKKGVTILVGALLAAPMAMAGCSSSSGASGSSGPAVITFSSWHFAEPGRGDALKKIIDSFNASQKDVKVNPVSIPYPNYASTVLTQLGAGAGADVVDIENAPWAAGVEKHVFADISGKVATPPGGFVPADKVASVGGKRYGVVYETANYALIINQDLLDKTGMAAPQNFDQFVAVAKAMTDTSKQQYGFAFRSTMAEQSGWWSDLCNFVYGNGGRWTDGSGSPTIDSPQVIKGIEEYKNVFDHFVPQGAPAATYRQMFWEGKVGMEIDNMAVPSIFLSKNPQMHLTVVPNPFPNPENSSILEFMAVNHSSKNIQADLKFLNYMLQSDVQKQLSKAMNYAGMATQIDWGNQPPSDMPPWRDTYAKISVHGVPQEPQGAETQTSAIQTAVLSEVDKVLRQSKDPAAAMADAQAAVAKLLKK